jgi:hypothetical protein
MILHAAHRWPQVITPHLWPYAIRLASDIGRNISQDSKEGEKKAKAPIQLFSRVPVKVQLKTYHPFGCPTYVLHDTLANGKYHPKWSDRTRVGVYLGHSSQHASTVALVLNVNTGHVSPVFHCVFDDHFDCVPTDRFVQSKWQELAKLLDKDAPNVQDYGQEENIPKGLKAPWYSSKTAAHKADNHRHNKETATRSSDEPPKKRARFVLNETREPEAQEAPIHTRSGRTIHQPRWLKESAQAYPCDMKALSDGTLELELGNNDNSLAFSADLTRADNDTLDLRGAREASDWGDFLIAMAKEMDDHQKRKHMRVVRKDSIKDLSKVDILMGVWSFKRKRTPTGELIKHKARLCAHGGQQRYGVSYEETYSPVVNWFTLRMLIILSIVKRWKTKQIDMVLAFPQADINPDIEIYIRIPYGMKINEPGDKRDYLLKVEKNIYGLKDAGRTWSEHLRDNLLKRGFKQSVIDQCLFYRGSMILVCYVDDIIAFSPKSQELEWLEESFAKQTNEYDSFEFTVEGEVAAYLGIEVSYEANGAIHLKQPYLINRICEAVGALEDQKRHDTPADPNARLMKFSDSQYLQTDINYRSVVGMLNYLAGTSRPDIAFATHQCARFCSDPRKPHFVALKRIGRYLATTADKGIIMNPQKEEQNLIAYCDADFAGDYCKEYSDDPSTAYSRTGYVITYGGCPIVWQSKMQTEIALSTTESEYMSLSACLRDVIVIQQLLEELTVKKFLGTKSEAIVKCTVFEDNKGCLEIATAPKMRPRTRHIAIKYHHFRSHVAKKTIHIKWVETSLQVADQFTKGLPRDAFCRLRKMLMGW